MIKKSLNYRSWLFPISIVISSMALLVISLHKLVFFHILVELAAVVVALVIFLATWAMRRYVNNVFFIYLGAGYLFIGLLDFMHILIYEGPNIFSGKEASIPSELWIMARFLEAIAFIVGLAMVSRNNAKKYSRLKYYLIITIYTLAFASTAFLTLAINKIIALPVSMVNISHDSIYGEYFVVSFFLVATALLFSKVKSFDKQVFNMFSLFLITKIMAEIFLMQHGKINDMSNVMGHVFIFLSSIFLGKAILEGALLNPFKFLFHDLKENEERYRTLVEFSPDAIVVHRMGKVIYVNGVAKRIFGIDKDDEAIGKDLIEFFSLEYREHIRTRIKNILSGKWQESPIAEMRIEQESGHTIAVEVKSIKVRYKGEDVIESVVRDISTEKAAAEKIASLAKFTEEDPSPVFRVSSDGLVTYANKPARKLLYHSGWTDENNALPEQLSIAVKHVLVKKIRKEIEFICGCGRMFSVVLAPGINGHWVNVYGLDITKRKIAEKELTKMQNESRKKMEGQLVESYEYLGMVNRKISLLLEMDEYLKNKKDKQEVINYVLNSLMNVSRAKIGMMYLKVGQNYFSLLHSVGLEGGMNSKLQVINENSAKFLPEMINSGKRINGLCEVVSPTCFNDILSFEYFVALPIISADLLKGFLFLGFNDRKSMDMQDLEFLDVFAKHISMALESSNVIKRCEC